MTPSPLLQTDPRLREEPSIGPFGCFWVTLRQIAERHVGAALDPATNLEMYRWLVAEGHLKDEDGRRAYVMDHAAVINAGLYYLNHPQTAVYVGAAYVRPMDQDRSWGRLSTANYFAGQGNFAGYGISHFYESDRDGRKVWDPYWPHGHQTSLISIRGFRL